MAYTREQRKVQRRIVRIGRRRGESRREILANLQTGGVETKWRNLRYGHADSKNYRQEREQYYGDEWARTGGPQNLNAAINRWYDEANEFPHLRGGRLAQAVQQSAFPGRYKEYGDEARAILASFGGGGGTRTTTRIPGVDNSDLRQSLKLQYLAQRGEPDALLNLAAGLEGAEDVPGRTVMTPGRRIRKAASDGQIRRDNWKGSKSAGSGVLKFAKANGLSVVSEKRPTRSTASGGVSDHYEGNRDSYAWDLSNGSAPTPQMDRAARKIVRSLGGRYDGKSELVFTTTRVIDGRRYRFQVLYRTQVGGNHDDHIHVGIDRVDTPG